MRLRCPNCQIALEVVGEETVVSLSCPTCGQQIEQAILGEETISYDLQQGERIAHFEFVQFLGRGAFGAVWKAHDEELDRFVALKIPRTSQLDDHTVQQFCREARAASQINHPNIVSVYEIGREADTIYIASEFIDGVSLKDRLTSKQFAVRDAADLVATLAESLHHAHEAGIIHRDLKPGNVLIDGQGQPHLTDFGLAKRESAEMTVTAEGQVLGTIAYMSPEQARGDSRKADRRSDVYSLGVIFYEMLSGQKPFSASKTRLLLHQVQHDEPTALRTVNPRIPRDLETICAKAMQKDPSKRYATAAEMADDLRRFLRGEPIQARPVTRIERAWRWSRRNPAAATAIVLAMGVGGLLAAVFTPSEMPAAVPGMEPKAVRMTTIPPGARLVFHPLDPLTGEPQPENAVRPQETTPLETELVPGDYLVVAVSNEEGYSFHEVFRRVPATNALSGQYRHRSWTVADDGVIELPEIEIPDSAVTEGMASFPGDAVFTIGDATRPDLPPHQRSVPPFLLDPTEVTVGEMRTELVTPPEFVAYDNADLEPQNPDAIGFVAWDHAVAYAERIGKRLPDEWEYEFAATNGGQSRFPWGDDATQITSWEFGPPGQAEWDVLPTDPPVQGLFSNVAEWTASWPNVYPAHRQLRLPPPSDAAERRVVRGAPFALLLDRVELEQLRSGTPRERVVFPRKTWNRSIGIRCARSQRPRLQPEDFGHEIED